MTSFLDKLTKHFDDTGLKSVEVPEIGETLYFRLPTFAEASAIARGVKGDDHIELMVRTIIKKALNEKGEPLFSDTPETKVALQSRVDSHILQRIVVAMGEAPEVDEVKND